MARVTITDLAKELGISVCTVNKALTGKPRISEETRERVKAAAERLGYKANAVARSMGRPVIKLAAIHPEAWPSHNAELYRGVRERLAELSDYRVEASFKTFKSFSDANAFQKALKASLKEGCDGIIASLGDFEPEELKAIWREFENAGVPHLILGSPAEGANSQISCVWQDCRLGGKLAAQLLAMSLPKDAETAIFIGRKNHPDHRLKIEGFKDEMKRFGRPEPEVCEAYDKHEMGFPAAKRLFKEKPGTAGIYIGTENAEGILEYLERSGLAGKVKAVATGIGEPVGKAIERGHANAAIHQRQSVQGRLAVDTLFSYLEDGARPEMEILVAPQILLQGNFKQAER